MKNDLFDETFVLINCVLRDKIFIIAMIDIDVIEYAFVDESIAQSLCEILKIESVQLIKKRLIKVYDERKNQIIIHVICSKMIIQKHIESFISMLIIKLKQRTLILEKLWMRKHEVNYHEKTNIIEFVSKFCTHSKRIKTKTTNKENISFKKKFFLHQSNHSKYDLKKDIKIIIKILFRKDVYFDQSVDQSTSNLSRKDKKSIKFVKEMKILNAIKNFRLNFNKLEIFNSKEKKLFKINIAMIKTSTFNMMSKRKNVNLFLIILKNVKKHLEKHNKFDIVIKDVFSLKYHKFLNVFDKKAFNTFASHRSYDHKILFEKNVISDYISLYKMLKKKLKIIKKYLENNLKKKFIAANRFLFVSSIMFMKKTNDLFKFCVDYRKLNQLIKKKSILFVINRRNIRSFEKDKICH
jgi:hypothetical protein